MEWLIYAFLSAIFAALVAILAKIGIKNVDSNVATAVRTLVILVFALGIVAAQGKLKDIGKISSYSMLFLVLSGVATGLSWLFYFRALQLGNASQVAPIDKLSLVLTIVFAFFILKEPVNLQVIIGGLLMTIGTILIALAR
jgi:transporter family protein